MDKIIKMKNKHAAQMIKKFSIGGKQAGRNFRLSRITTDGCRLGYALYQIQVDRL